MHHVIGRDQGYLITLHQYMTTSHLTTSAENYGTRVLNSKEGSHCFSNQLMQDTHKKEHTLIYFFLQEQGFPLAVHLHIGPQEQEQDDFSFSSACLQAHAFPSAVHLHPAGQGQAIF